MVNSFFLVAAGEEGDPLIQDKRSTQLISSHTLDCKLHDASSALFEELKLPDVIKSRDIFEELVKISFRTALRFLNLLFKVTDTEICWNNQWEEDFFITN